MFVTVLCCIIAAAHAIPWRGQLGDVQNRAYSPASVSNTIGLGSTNAFFSLHARQSITIGEGNTLFTGGDSTDSTWLYTLRPDETTISGVNRDWDMPNTLKDVFTIVCLGPSKTPGATYGVAFFEATTMSFQDMNGANTVGAQREAPLPPNVVGNVTIPLLPSSCVFSDDGIVYVTVGLSPTVNQTNGLLAFDFQTAKLLWSSSDLAQITDARVMNNPPALASGLVFVSLAGEIVALDAAGNTGAQRYIYDFEGNNNCAMAVSPVVASDRYVFATCGLSMLVADHREIAAGLNHNNNSALFVYQFATHVTGNLALVESPTAITIVVAQLNTLLRLDFEKDENGAISLIQARIMWEFIYNAHPVGPPPQFNGVSVGGDTVVAVGGTDVLAVAFSLQNGTILWAVGLPLQDGVGERPVPAISGDGTVYVVNPGDGLYRLTNTPHGTVPQNAIKMFASVSTFTGYFVAVMSFETKIDYMYNTYVDFRIACDNPSNDLGKFTFGFGTSVDLRNSELLLCDDAQCAFTMAPSDYGITRDTCASVKFCAALISRETGEGSILSCDSVETPASNPFLSPSPWILPSFDPVPTYVPPPDNQFPTWGWIVVGMGCMLTVFSVVLRIMIITRRRRANAIIVQHTHVPYVQMPNNNNNQNGGYVHHGPYAYSGPHPGHPGPNGNIAPGPTSAV